MGLEQMEPCVCGLRQFAPRPERNWYHYFQYEEQNIMRTAMTEAGQV